MTRALLATLLVATTLSSLTGCPDSTPGGGTPSASDGDQPGLTITDSVGPDGCPIVDLDPSAWRPLHASFTGGADPYFHLHSTEDVLFFGAELYTEYGAGWTGQTGTFAPDCGTNGICVYLVPDGQTVTRATAGFVDVVALTENGGTIQRPAEVVFRELTLVGTEDPSTCFHVEEVTLAVQ